MQEVALKLGYSGAALPLWQEFLVRYLSYQTQLQHVVPTAEIGRHLAQLAQLYEAQSPALGEICTCIAPLSPEALPGTIASHAAVATTLVCVNYIRRMLLQELQSAQSD